ncbi:MAG: SUMF1/EgtB/PvdO family nonheme iron enzyme [Polyangia bacterium]|jgi:formylglycine-generating enzyme required for sulfatase activity|nr:SUMF1/EgtB/PvdO family nonheme iron enzyme [Polyangia bacterium]
MKANTPREHLLAVRRYSVIAGLAVFVLHHHACRDGGSVAQDADAATPVDSTPGHDGSPDAESETDASTGIDQDGDGFPAERDCNDFDRAVYPGVTRTCSTVCDTGTQTCGEDGEWTPCTAISDCNCSTPGETRLVPCGNCGEAEQVCGADNVWSAPGVCELEGPCAPGQQNQVTCPFCGTGVQECQTDCNWGLADCSGECTPGETEITEIGCTEPWQRQRRECDASCTWIAQQPCTEQCLTAARQGAGDFKEDICIPGGPFLMGSAEGVGDADEHPARTVTLSPYFIDKYEVTYGRYLECVSAGVCLAANVPSSYVLPAAAFRPIVGLNRAMAIVFCNWDGGRVLPTEAQWEKAARGPSPRTVLNPWGDEPGTCELCGGNECIEPGWYGAWPVDQHPLDISYYGVVGMAGNVLEFCADWYDATYYTYGAGHDPPGPSTGSQIVRRGYSYLSSLSVITRATSNRNPDLPQYLYTYLGFRCARPGW